MKLNDKEHYDLMAQFEKTYSYLRLDREKNFDYQKIGQLYESGETNELFKAYRAGYAFGVFENTVMRGEKG